MPRALELISFFSSVMVRLIRVRYNEGKLYFEIELSNSLNKRVKRLQKFETDIREFQPSPIQNQTSGSGVALATPTFSQASTVIQTRANDYLRAFCERPRLKCGEAVCWIC